MAIVASLMKTEMVTVSPDDTVAAAARLMNQNKVGAVLVVAGGAATGLFSERDLLTRVVAAGTDPSKVRVSEVASSPVIAVARTASVRECVDLLRAKRIRHLAVVDGGKPIGILSARDFLEAVVEGFEKLVDKNQYDAVVASGADPYDHIGGSYGR
ncbi:MAG: CBS domain-containing protein [bacterium]